MRDAGDVSAIDKTESRVEVELKLNCEYDGEVEQGQADLFSWSR